ncbi:MAG TPA: bifunctional precorrin-2 dehydrogenase/sirohydrochlorin ferrochelatase, partial [Methylophaga sp.]|nr:bifunctional precorrin-2 dehydrogenase/sirohydrochlorin ferrochelatase [Methylophaga sp.]
MDYLPIFVDLKDRPCLVVGGGDIAARKAGLLRKAQAAVTLVAPEVSATTQALIDSGEVKWLNTVFSAEQLADNTLVIAATDNEDVNRDVYRQAKANNILVNVADCPELCDFILPSILDRSPIVVAISSGGKSPILARQLRARLETLIPPAYGRLAEMVGQYRDAVKEKMPKLSMRRRFWESILQGSVADHVLSGRDELGEQTLQSALE